MPKLCKLRRPKTTSLPPSSCTNLVNMTSNVNKTTFPSPTKMPAGPNSPAPATDMTPTKAHAPTNDNMITLTQVQKITNPYSIRKAPVEDSIRPTKVGQFLALAQDYISIITTHDKSKLVRLWYQQWSTWITNGVLDPTATVRTVATITELPLRQQLSIKNIGLHILETIPELQKYLRIPWKTKHDAPLVYFTTPTVHAPEQSTNQPNPMASNKTPTLESNPISAVIADNMENTSPLGESIEELQEENDDEQPSELQIEDISPDATTTSTNLNAELNLATKTMTDILTDMAGVQIPDMLDAAITAAHTNTTTEKVLATTPPPSIANAQSQHTSPFPTSTDIDRYWNAKIQEFNSSVQESKNILTTAATSIKSQLNVELTRVKNVMTTEGKNICNNNSTLLNDEGSTILKKSIRTTTRHK